jgi:hypothetical protein
LKKLYLLLPCLILAFALSACGSSSSDSTGGSGDSTSASSSGDEAQIEETIQKSLAEPSPAACKELETKAFVEQTMHATGTQAMKACEELGGESNAESVDVSNIQVDGSSATAEVAFSGGAFSDQTLVLALNKEGDNWKLNEITKFAKLEKKALLKAIEEQLQELPSNISGCIIDGLNKASDETFEALLLKGEDQPLEELAKSCAQG